MALKRLPPELDYAALRDRHPPKMKERASEPPPGSSDGQEHPSAHEDPDSKKRDGAALPEAPSSLPGPVDPTAPLPDVPTETGQAELVASDKSVAPRPAKGPAGLQRPSNGRVKIRGYVLVPEHGAFAKFDALVETYGDKDAVRFALSAALDDYANDLRDARALGPPATYAGRKRRIEAMRMMPADVHDMAILHLDPYKMMGVSTLGSRIFKTALGRYLGKA